MSRNPMKLTVALFIRAEKLNAKTRELLEANGLTFSDFSKPMSSSMIGREELQAVMDNARLHGVFIMEDSVRDVFLMGAGYAYNKLVIVFDPDTVIRNFGLGYVVLAVSNLLEMEYVLSCIGKLDLNNWDTVQEAMTKMAEYLEKRRL